MVHGVRLQLTLLPLHIGFHAGDQGLKLGQIADTFKRRVMIQLELPTSSPAGIDCPLQRDYCGVRIA